MFNYRSTSICIKVIRQFATVKPIVQLDPNVSDEIDRVSYKPKHHPGRITLKTVTVPKHLITSIYNIIEDYPIKSIIEESKYLARFLLTRQHPLEMHQIQDIEKQIRKDIVSNTDCSHLTERRLQSLNDSVKSKLLQKIHNRSSVEYNVHNSLLYLLARFAPEYAVLLQIFTEISTRDPDFKPRSLFDFGSGTGTVSWAAKHIWDKQLYEFFNVDSSSEMNELAQLLIQGGRPTNQCNFKGIFFRQFLPANHIAYDLVVSAYALVDLPTRKSRLQTLLNLWNKSVNYLVLVERGTKSGFELINEARSFILNLKNGHEGHVFSPCPHDDVCPKFINDIRCNFEVPYYSLQIGSVAQSRREKYSYVVFKKALRDKNNITWPRLVEKPLVRSRHVICRMCTNRGKLDEVIFTPSKHGKVTYRCARSSKWGDLLPISLTNES